MTFKWKSSYEDLQARTGETLVKLFQFFSVDIAERELLQLNPSTTKKFTTDNLKAS